MTISSYCWGHPVLEYLRSQRSCIGFEQKEAWSLRNVPAPSIEGPPTKEICTSPGLKASPLGNAWYVLVKSQLVCTLTLLRVPPHPAQNHSFPLLNLPMLQSTEKQPIGWILLAPTSSLNSPPCGCCKLFLENLAMYT